MIALSYFGGSDLIVKIILFHQNVTNFDIHILKYVKNSTLFSIMPRPIFCNHSFYEAKYHFLLLNRMNTCIFTMRIGCFKNIMFYQQCDHENLESPGFLVNVDTSNDPRASKNPDSPGITRIHRNASIKRHRERAPKRTPKE